MSLLGVSLLGDALCSTQEALRDGWKHWGMDALLPMLGQAAFGTSGESQHLPHAVTCVWLCRAPQCQHGSAPQGQIPGG